MALTDGKAHFVGVHAEFLGERLPQCDHQRVGAGPAKRMLRLKFEDVGRDF